MTPDRARLARACHLVAQRRDDGTWLVMGGATEHVVSADGGECDCVDSLVRRGSICKHRLRIQLGLGDPSIIAGLRQIVPLPRRKAS